MYLMKNRNNTSWRTPKWWMSLSCDSLKRTACFLENKISITKIILLNFWKPLSLMRTTNFHKLKRFSNFAKFKTSNNFKALFSPKDTLAFKQNANKKKRPSRNQMIYRSQDCRKKKNQKSQYKIWKMRSTLIYDFSFLSSEKILN